jgi:thioredoxin 1
MKKTIIGLLSVIFFSLALAQNIAEVNGKKISLKFLKQELEKLPLEQQENYTEDYPAFLEEVINQELFRQEAIQQRLDTIPEVKAKIKQDKSMRNNILVDELLEREIRSKIQVSEDEMLNYFKTKREEMKGFTYQQMKIQIFQTLLNQKQSNAIKLYVADLRSRAKITYNEKWRKSEEAKTNNPIKQALKNKLPTMVDFGAGTCIPCIQMKPIIAELQKEYENRANILIVDVNEQSLLTRKYKIMLIPTQIFYDTEGKETNRHIGFFPKDSILINLKQAGLK